MYIQINVFRKEIKLKKLSKNIISDFKLLYANIPNKPSKSKRINFK